MLSIITDFLKATKNKKAQAKENTLDETETKPSISLLDECVADVTAKIANGKAGQLKLAPKSIWLNISENCNLRCIGCYSEGKFKKIYSTIEDVKKSIQFAGRIEEISFTTNEALLHPQFCEIIDICREAHPTAKLWVITNGTIPIKGRYKNAISKLNKVGLSIDGATKETFESIRIGARFEDFIENAKSIIEIKRQTGFPTEVTFAFTATSTNIHELTDVVRLAHELGATDVWAQAMEAKNDIIRSRISEILLDKLDPLLRTKLIDEARTEAARLGVGFNFSQGIYPSIAEIAAEQDNRTIDKSAYVRMCQYPWTEPVQISKFAEGYVVRPCCYISTTKIGTLADKYGLKFSEILSGEEIYNSPQLWRFREDLLAGRTTDVCGSCDAARGYPWRKPTIPTDA